MPLKFNKKNYRILVRKANQIEDWIETQGLVCGAFGIERKTNVITHLPTGWRMSRCRSQKQARKIVGNLLDIDVDWNQINIDNWPRFELYGEELWQLARDAIQKEF